MSLSNMAFLSPAIFPTRRSLFTPLNTRRPSCHSSRPSAPRMQVWSDPAVTQEYLDYIQGINQRADTVDCPSTIVGAGRLGDFIRSLGDGKDIVVRRGQRIPPDAPGPVYVCARNDDLESVISECPPEKLDDLVFMQNGMLEKLLRKHGRFDNTKANIYFAVTSIGADPIDGVTEENPQGLTCVCGKWEGAFCDRLVKGGLTCTIKKERDFRRSQLEKLIFISIYNLLGAVHGNIPMGEVSRMHVKEVTELAVEMATMIRYSLTVGMLPDIEQRMLTYGTSIKDFPTAFKEFKWRNGFFLDHSLLAKKNGFPDPTPMHT